MSEPAGIEDGEGDTFVAGKADTGGIYEGSVEALGVLRLVNHATYDELHHAVELSSRVSHNIINYRAGADGTLGTSDDRTFTSLIELDAVPYVGVSVFQRLLAYARDIGYVVSSVTITLTDALVAPFTSIGEQWDGIGGNAPAETITQLAEALLDEPYGAVLEIVTGIASAYAGPDPIATAEIFTGGSWNPGRRLDLSVPGGNQDTVTPIWNGAAWHGVPLESSLRLRIHVLEDDYDILYDDPIGDAEIGYQDLTTALAKQSIYQVKVADQTHNQLLFVGVSVAVEHSGATH